MAGKINFLLACCGGLLFCSQKADCTSRVLDILKENKLKISFDYKLKPDSILKNDILLKFAQKYGNKSSDLSGATKASTEPLHQDKNLNSQQENSWLPITTHEAQEVNLHYIKSIYASALAENTLPETDI